MNPPIEQNQVGLLLIVGTSKTSDTVAQRITSRGYRVDVTSSARDAVSRVSLGEVSAILLDLTSSQASLDLADTLMGLPACPPIVILDTAPTIERVVGALRIGADGDETRVPPPTIAWLRRRGWQPCPADSATRE